MPTIVPMLSYEDGIRAMDFLVEAFGFHEEVRMMHEGRLAHGELSLNGAKIMLASPSPAYQSPKTLRENYPPAAKWLEVPYIFDGVLVYVHDLDAHLERARQAGATILSEIEDGYPGRRYRAEDLEGHRWFFFEAPGE